MKKKWRIYPRGAVFWITFGLIDIIIAMLIWAILIADWSAGIVFNVISTVVAGIVIVIILTVFFLANISIDENDCLNMPFFCRNLMPAFAEKKKKIILKKNLVDVHLKFVRIYMYLGFEDENGNITLINVTMFSKKQQAILQHKLEEYKTDQN